MKTPNLALISLLLIGAAVLGQETIQASSWSGYLGPNRDGTTLGTHFFEKSDYGLEVRWRKKLGSGYSDIVVAGDELFTMYSDGKDDYVVAMAQETGKSIWRYRIGDTYVGHGGSADGPLSTPLSYGDRLFALGPRGQFFALDKKSGRELWRIDLRATYNIEPPPWGFTSSPMALDDKIILGVGGEGESMVCAFDANTGRQVWCAGDGAVFYQSPRLMSFAGQPMIVASSTSHVMGIDPKSGQTLWKQLVNEKGFSATGALTQLNAKQFLICRGGFFGNYATYELNHDEGGWQISEAWAQKDLKQTYQVPILHGDVIIGNSNQFLIGVDPKSGNKLWTSRKPGKGQAIMVNGRLVTWCRDGSLRVGHVTASGYENERQIQVFDVGSFNLPSVGPRGFFLRNLWEIAAVDVVAEKQTSASTSEMPNLGKSTAFRSFIVRLQQSKNKADLITRFLDEHPSMPVIEDEGYVHFVYVGEGDDVAVMGTMAPEGETMYRVSGSSFFYRGYPIEADARWDYGFMVDYQSPIKDPRNTDSSGPGSEVKMRGWRTPAFFAQAQPEHAGKIESFDVKDRSETARSVTVYLPHGYEEAQSAFPLLVVNHGTSTFKHFEMQETLDKLMQQSIRPAVVAFVPFTEGRFGIYDESGGQKTGQYVDMLLDELIPELERRYRLSEGSDLRSVMGSGAGAHVSLLAALRSRGSIGTVAVQSIELQVHLRKLISAAIKENKKPLALSIDRCTYHRDAPDQDNDYPRDHQNLVNELKRAGHKVMEREIHASPGWLAWRSQLDLVLQTLLPLTETSATDVNSEPASK